MEELIKKWKEYNLDRAEFEFYAGGDSMGDTELYFYDKNNKEVEVDFASEMEDQIYKNVEFYEVSDGHYQGESGSVIITLLEVEGEEPYFEFTKDAQCEYTNHYNDAITVKLSEEEYKYLQNYVDEIHADYNFEFLYKKDFFLSEHMLVLEKCIEDKIKGIGNEHEFEYNGDGEIMDDNDYTYDGLEFLGENTISLSLHYRVTEYEASN